LRLKALLTTCRVSVTGSVAAPPVGKRALRYRAGVWRLWMPCSVLYPRSLYQPTMYIRRCHT